MKPKKMSEASKEDLSNASFKGKKKHKLPPVKKQKSNRNRFMDELEEFDEDDAYILDEDLEDFNEEDYDLDEDDLEENYEDY
jgi:hypothetical protein